MPQLALKSWYYQFETGPLRKPLFGWIRDSHKRTFDNAPPELGILAC
jgi:hypothetical protein